MSTYTIGENRTTAEEAVRIAMQLHYTDALVYLPAFMRDLHKCVNQTVWRDEMRIRYDLTCAAMWMAGRLHGIREERERRRNRKPRV